MIQDSAPGPAVLPEADHVDPALSPDTSASASEAPSENIADLRDDLTALMDDARTYAEAEIAFQKTRAALAGRAAGRALVALVLALVLLHLALIALAVGAVIALAPLVTIWGAIAIVVGAMLAGVAALVWAALKDGKLLAALFGPAGDDA